MADTSATSSRSGTNVKLTEPTEKQKKKMSEHTQFHTITVSYTAIQGYLSQQKGLWGYVEQTRTTHIKHIALNMWSKTNIYKTQASMTSYFTFYIIL